MTRGTSLVTVEQNVPARMRDGVTLYADVYRPAEAGNYPVLLTRMPYGKEQMRPMLSQFLDPVRAAQAGYIVVMQDCRGRFSSEGEFGPLAQEGPDGYDTVEWSAGLPDSSGAVGMWGGSYLGLVQWVAAEWRPPHLRALAPMAAPTTSVDGIFTAGGVLELPAALMLQLAFGLEASARRLRAEGKSPLEMIQATHAAVQAIEDLQKRDIVDLPLGRMASLEQLGLAECLAPLLNRDPSSIAFGEYQVDFSKVELPALLICGWYDGALRQCLKSYREVKTNGQGAARNPQLLIGPWAHGHLGIGRSTLLGEMEFGMAASAASIELMTDLTGVHLRWFDHWLKGADNGVDKQPPVQVFVMGENRWRRLPDWPARETQPTALFLGPDGSLGPAAPKKAASVGYVYHPSDPVPTLGGAGTPVGWHGLGVKDQSPLRTREDVITYCGPALTEPLTIAGPITARLWAASDAPDTDFVMRLIDLAPGGFMHNLCDGIVRARYRNSLSEPEWLEPGEVYEFEVDMWATAHTFLPGHRITLQVTSSNFPRWDRNLNTKDAPGEGTRGLPAQQAIWHGGAYASQVLLPVLSVS